MTAATTTTRGNAGGMKEEEHSLDAVAATTARQDMQQH